MRERNRQCGNLKRQSNTSKQFEICTLSQLGKGSQVSAQECPAVTYLLLPKTRAKRSRLKRMIKHYLKINRKKNCRVQQQPFFF